MKNRILSAILASAMAMTACGAASSDACQHISQEKAKEMMDTQEVLILDVREQDDRPEFVGRIAFRPVLLYTNKQNLYLEKDGKRSHGTQAVGGAGRRRPDGLYSQYPCADRGKTAQ